MIGLDHLGLGNHNYSVEKVIQFTPEGWAIGAFDNTFGDAFPKIRQIVQSGKFPAIRVHIWWSYQHKIVPIEVLQKEVPKYEQLAKSHPGVKIYLSHSCEYQESSIAEINKRVHTVQHLAPSCIPVQTPMHSPVVPNIMIEVHGKDAHAKPGQIASLDGNTAPDTDMEAWNLANIHAEIRFLWAFRFNLFEGGEIPPPPQRTAAPDGKYIAAVARLGLPIGSPPPPLFTGPITSIKKPLLYKTFAEDLSGNQPRDNKPCLIVPVKESFAEIVTYKDQHLGNLKYWDTFGSGLFRYYSGLPGGVNLYGNEIGEKALQLSSSEWVWFRVGNRYYGPVNPAFRSGYFR